MYSKISTHDCSYHSGSNKPESQTVVSTLN